MLSSLDEVVLDSTSSLSQHSRLPYYGLLPFRVHMTGSIESYHLIQYMWSPVGALWYPLD